MSTNIMDGMWYPLPTAEFWSSVRITCDSPGAMDSRMLTGKPCT